MFGVNNRGLGLVLAEQVLQCLLAFNLGKFAEVAVTPQYKS